MKTQFIEKSGKKKLVIDDDRVCIFQQDTKTKDIRYTFGVYDIDRIELKKPFCLFDGNLIITIKNHHQFIKYQKQDMAIILDIYHFLESKMEHHDSLFLDAKRHLSYDPAYHQTTAHRNKLPKTKKKVKLSFFWLVFVIELITLPLQVIYKLTSSSKRTRH